MNKAVSPSPATALLTGVRVLDLSRVLAGPLCAQYLGDMGAEVIKVEALGGGDDTRMWPEFRTAANGQQITGPFLSANRNKRSIVVDLKSERGRAIIQALTRQSDVVVESFAPGVAQRLGVDALTLRPLNPRLIHCSISGFGTVGPMREGKGYDLILQAFSGMMSITGEAGSPPMRSPFSPVDQATGIHALVGILAALNRRHVTGEGATIEASLFDTSAAFLGYFLQNYWECGEEPKKAGVGHASLCPYGVFDTADRPLILGIANDALWRKFCAVAGLTDDPSIEGLNSNAERVKRRAETEALVARALRRHDREYWMKKLDEARIPCTAVHSLGEMSAHPHTAASGMVLEYEHSRFGSMKGVAQPLRFDGERCAQRLTPPMPGEHTADVLRELGIVDADIEALIAQGVVATCGSA